MISTGRATGADHPGCPRWGQPDRGGRYDDFRWDPENHNTHQFEPLNAGGGHRWRHIAEHIAEVDQQYRIRRRRDHGLGDDPDVDLQSWVEKMIVAARHIASMLHNGIQYEGNDPERRLESVYRRIRFDHHGLYLRNYHMLLQQRAPEWWFIPGGMALYGDLLPYSRGLKFSDNAVPLAPEDCREEWARIRAVVED